MLRILIILLFISKFSLAQTTFEFRNFYTNLPLKEEKIYVNKQALKLDSIGQFKVDSLMDSLYIEFSNKHAHRILIDIKDLNKDKLFTIYQFDQYSAMATSVYVLRKSWFGLVKRYTYEAGPTEEYDKHDIFINRNSFVIKLDNSTYDYSLNGKNDKFIYLEIR